MKRALNVKNCKRQKQYNHIKNCRAYSFVRKWLKIYIFSRMLYQQQ